MANMSDRMSEAQADAQEQIRQLREQVGALMRERAGPSMTEAASRARGYAKQAREAAESRTEAFSQQIRDMPIAAVLIAAASGFLVGRLFSR